MRKVKILPLLLSVVMVLSCLAGCSNGSESGKNAKGDQTKIQIKYWLAGFGKDWIEDVVDAFEKKYPQYDVVVESTSSQQALTAALGQEDLDETDLYLGTKNYNVDGYMEPLDDVLATTVEGESKPLGEKFNQNYLQLEKAADGHYYCLTIGGGLVGIYYNQKLFEKVGITQEPRTTDELVIACDSLYSEGYKAFCHYKPVGYWEDYMGDLFFAQYDGIDYVLNNFYSCKDEKTGTLSLDMFTREDGRYEALKVMAQLVTPEYTMVGSNTNDHTTVQTMWLQEEATMMVTGSWVISEMKNIKGIENITLMRTPVISSIVDKLTTVKTDKELRSVISAIDSVVDGVKQESEYKQGENYVIDGLKVSQADWNKVREARTMIATNSSGNSACIPNYSDAKEGAKLFLQYLYSDEGYKVYAESLQQTLPLHLDEGEIDMSSWSDLAKKQADYFDKAEHLASMHYAGKNIIFIEGGAQWKSLSTTYCNRFCSTNVNDRMTAAAAWEDTVQYAKDNYSRWQKLFNSKE